MQGIPVSYRAPFDVGKEPWRDVRPHGQTILEIVESVPDLPEGFLTRGGVVCINSQPVPRNLWEYIRPKPATEECPITVTLHWPLQSPGGGGGGRSSAKSIVAIVAAIALIVVTAVIAGPVGAGLLGSFGTATFLGITGAQIVAGAVGIAGALAISALTAPPSQQSALADPANQDNKDPAAASGNVISPGGSIPRVIGTRKVFPVLIAEPVVTVLDGNDEQVEAIYALNGPHNLSSIQIDGADISSMSDVQFETKAGNSGDSSISLIQRQGRTTLLNLTMTQHKLQANNFLLLNNSTGDHPQWHRFTTFNSPDSVRIAVYFPTGVNAVAPNYAAVPFRMRMRPVGTSTWINFPEFHFGKASAQPLKREIRIYWADGGGPAFVPASGDWFYARYNVPGQTVPPTTGGGSPPTFQWQTNSYFDNGQSPPANDYVYSGVEGSTRLNHMFIGNTYADFYVSGSGGFSKGRYEIEIIRGCAYFTASFTPSTYQYAGGGNIFDFFQSFQNGGFGGALTTAQDQTNFASQTIIPRVTNIWEQHPVNQGQGKFAMIAIVAKNRNLNNVSCLASGLVPTWNGSIWTGSNASSNPAAHYRHVLIGAQNKDPLDSTLLDNAGLQFWYTYCNTYGWTVDAIIDDMRTQDVLNLIASCGYARPYQSDQYGVAIDRDRSGDSPIQVFSRLNTANLRYEKAFARVPSGLIITYHDSANDYGQNQNIINQSDGSVGITGLYETIQYDGIVNSSKINARGQFDLDQANLRSTFYSFDTDVESLVCRRGDLVALQHDTLLQEASDAHIKTVLTSGGNITGLVLDNQLPTYAGTPGIAIRHTDGTISTHQIHNPITDNNTITFTTPFAISSTIKGYDDTNDELGCMIVAGYLSTIYRRMLVQSITPTKDLRASVTLVDEAPDLNRYGGG